MTIQQKRGKFVVIKNITTNLLGGMDMNVQRCLEILREVKDVAFAMVFSITHRCVNLIRASCYSI